MDHLASGLVYYIVGLLVAWQVFDLLYDPIFTVARNLLYPGASYG
jgi:hypothetical protein